MSIEFEYNGEKIICPDMPSEYLEVLPYYSIFVVTVASQTYCMAIMTQNEMFFAPEALAQQGLGLSSSTICSFGAGYLYSFLVANEWDPFKEKSAGFCLHNVFDYEITNWDVVWSNHDILELTGVDDNGDPTSNGTIYFTSSVTTAEPFILPDGTELPALPEGCFEKYPYGMISYVESTDGEAAYALSVAEGTYIFAPGSATGEGSDYVISLLPGYRHYRYVVAPTAASGWEQYAESTTQHSGHDFSREDGTIEIRWCNHDILTATAMNDDGTPEIGPDLYRKSDVNYRVYGGWLNSMGNQARRLGNVSGALKPGEMESVFSGATLEPLTVTPTTEEQTFTPESPCIGFSVVTVEAAPDTGGGDIVEPEELPNGETTTFGHIYTSETKTVTKYGGIALPDMPFDTTTYPRYAIYQSGDYYHVYHAPYKNAYYALRYISSNDSVQCGGEFMPLYKMPINGGGGWEFVANYMVAPGDTVNYLFTSYTIYVDTNSTSGTVWLEGSEPVEETVVIKVSNPVSREDEYRMLGDTMNTLCHLAQEASKSEELMTPAAALAILGELVTNATT